MPAPAAGPDCATEGTTPGWHDNSRGIRRLVDYFGDWQPSTTRFPSGIIEALEVIQKLGLVPGLWLEPEVVGVRSPMAERLSDHAFLTRRARRIAEAGRYHLDLRHLVARSHLDATIHRLVGELGVRYFKFDYNIKPGPGTDTGGTGAGAGLLGHNQQDVGRYVPIAVAATMADAARAGSLVGLPECGNRP